MKNIPYLHRGEDGTYLVVDGAPFLPLGGELHNSSSADLAFMDEVVWPSLRQLGGNCYLVPFYWEMIEPKEGEFDFSVVDGLLAQARREGVKMIPLWFGTWKNGASDYVPLWLKEQTERYFFAKDENGVLLHTVSPFCEEVLEADKKAFAALMEHLKEVDGEENTVIMIQVENEVGIWNHDRDFSEPANALFFQEIPEEMKALFGVEGTWEEAFGEKACNYFMSWAYSRAVEKVASAGKEKYPIPMYTNCVPLGMGFFPAGGPDVLYYKIWHAFAGSIDIFSPDIYAPTFREIASRFKTEENPLFIPESNCDTNAASRFLYVMGSLNCMGFSPFGIEECFTLMTDLDYASNGFEQLGLDETGANLRKCYSIVSNLWPQIRQAHVENRICGFFQQADERMEEFTLSNSRVKVFYGRGTMRGPVKEGEQRLRAGGFILETGENQFLICAINCFFQFSPLSGGTGRYFIKDKRAMRFEDGKLVSGRIFNGDERNRTGIGVTPELIRVELYEGR